MKWAILGFGAVALLFGGVGQAGAGLVTYSSQASFNAATSGLQTQTFKDAANNVNVINDGDMAAFGNPLDNGTNTGILLGLTITATTNVGDVLALLAPNFAGTGLTNYSVFANFGGNGLNFAFSPGVTAASLDVLSLGSSSDISVSVFSTSSALLGTFTVSGAPNTGAGKFFGVTSFGGDIIGSLTITAPNGPFVGADQVQFGSAAGSTVVPEPSTFVISSILFGMFGVVWSYRRLTPAAA